MMQPLRRVFSIRASCSLPIAAWALSHLRGLLCPHPILAYCVIHAKASTKVVTVILHVLQIWHK